MKKVFLAVLIYAVLCLNACSIRGDLPEKGVWHCDELKMSIDFSALSKNPDCVRLYSGDGTYIVLRCYIDYGTGISICSPEQDKDYLVGNLEYENGIFEVTAKDGTVYQFAQKTGSDSSS